MENCDLNLKIRTIRSFVKRSGRMTNGQKKALEQNFPLYGLAVDNEPINFTSVFGRQVPIVLEIGFGMGETLLKMAQQNPEKDFIGVEVFTPGVGALLAQLVTLGITNVRVFSVDVWQVLTKSIPDNSLKRVNLFFPDPWPKKRHHKRRLVQTDFVNLLAKKIKTEGIFHLATDWYDYAQHMMQVLEDNEFFENFYGSGNWAPNNLRFCTKFERRGKKLGHGVWDLIFNRSFAI